MNSLVNCPGCGFRGRPPEVLAALKSIVCPQCKTAVPVGQLRRGATDVEDASHPIWVAAAPDRTPPPLPEPELYAGDHMKDEAGRFAQYVAARLGELHKKRIQLAEAECRFESMTMGQKQEVHRARAAGVAKAERLKAREAEVAAKEARVSRAESRASDTDRRTAELRAAIDQLEARRAALAEERVALDRRAEALDRAELAQHRRAAELDEVDERLRLEQEEFERERERSV